MLLRDPDSLEKVNPKKTGSKAPPNGPVCPLSQRDKAEERRWAETTESSDTTRENSSDSLRPYKEWDPLLNVLKTSGKIRTHASVYSTRACHCPLGNGTAGCRPTTDALLVFLDFFAIFGCILACVECLIHLKPSQVSSGVQSSLLPLKLTRFCDMSPSISLVTYVA